MNYPRDHTSYSAYSKFDECPRRWWFDYVRYPEEKHDVFAFVLGDAYHEAIASMYKGKTLEDCLDEYDRLIRDARMSIVFKDVSAIREAIEYYYSAIYPQYRSRIGEVEINKTVKIPGIKTDFMFRMDLSTIDDVLVDHKTVGGRAPSIRSSEQLDIYAYIHMLETGRLPRAVEYHLAYKSPKGKEKVEVKSKTPQLSSVLKTMSKVKSSLMMIENNNFPCRQGTPCRWCPYVAECDRLIISSDGEHTI